MARLREWDPVAYASPPEFHAEAFRFGSFAEFDSALLGHAVPYLTSLDRYATTAAALFADQVANNVRYCEVSFHLPMSVFLDLPVQAFVDTILGQAPPGLAVRVFAGMLRSDYDGPARPIIDSLPTVTGLAGVDLHGDESTPTPPHLGPLWHRLRDAGLVTKSHAGEFDGPHRVREAIETLGVRRVQHGVRAVEDPDVVSLAAATGTIFDMCPRSNVRLGVTPDLRVHPLPELRAAGVRVTVSRDDAFIFPGSMNDLYADLATEMGLGFADLAALARTGFEAALLDDATTHISEIDRVVREWEGSA